MKSQSKPSKNLKFKILPLVQPNPDNTPIDRMIIKKLCAAGLDDSPREDRCIAWLCLLKVYPQFAAEWPAKLNELYHSYGEFRKDFQLDNWDKLNIENGMSKGMLPVSDQNLMSLIHNDIIRTAHLIFFLEPKVVSEPFDKNDLLLPFCDHCRRLERILYIFASINISLNYIQGFNEIVLPLYFVFSSCQDILGGMDYVEAVTFYAFQQLLTDSKVEQFYSIRESQSEILQNNLKEFTRLLKKHAPEHYKIIKSHRISPFYYAYRWFNLLFAQEYDMPSLLLIWDALIGHQEKMIEYMFYLGIAQVQMNENKLDPESFSKTLLSLQSMKINNVCSLIHVANQMYDASISKIVHKNV